MNKFITFSDRVVASCEKYQLPNVEINLNDFNLTHVAVGKTVNKKDEDYLILKYEANKDIPVESVKVYTTMTGDLINASFTVCNGVTKNQVNAYFRKDRIKALLEDEE